MKRKPSPEKAGEELLLGLLALELCLVEHAVRGDLPLQVELSARGVGRAAQGRALVWRLYVRWTSVLSVEARR